MNRIIKKTFNEHTEGDNELNETLFHTANGYIGVRGSLEEGVPKGWNTMRGTYINGLYDVIPMKQAENLCNFVDKKDTMVNVADTMTIGLKVDGEEFDMTNGTLIEHTRVLNMEEGYAHRRVLWKSKRGKTYEINIKRMTSFELLTFFSIKYEVRALDKASLIEIDSHHIADVANYSNPKDPRMAVESLRNLNVLDMWAEDKMSCQISETLTSKLKVCSVVHNEALDSEGNIIEAEQKKENFRITESFKASLNKGDSVTLLKYCIYTDSIRYEDVEKAAKQDLRRVIDKGLDYYYQKQKEYLDRFWERSNMEIIGDERSNNAVAFNMYELLQSSAKDKYCSIAAKGMSGEGYEGHYFWDTEVFILPFFIMTNPNLAKMILSYRYQTLDKARENAKLLGHKSGALFPWRTIAGEECSGYFVSGSAAYHINADIAYAIISYYLTSGDFEFIKNIGEEILIETARLWLDLGNYNSSGHFVINEVTGPDEYTCMVNNNYYTNCAAKYNIEWAVKLYREIEIRCAGEDGDIGIESIKNLRVTKKELCRMARAADKMLLPYDERLGINPQDDSFLNKPIWDFDNTPRENYPLLLHYHPLHLYRFQVCKQADTVLAYFMFEEMQNYYVMRRSYDYYEIITTHDSSLSTCVFSIVASRLGMHEKGFDYFGDSIRLDLENTHNNTKDGMHTANMGGCYMAIVNGFAGLRCREEGLYIAPFVPGDWAGYKFNFVYRGRIINISVNRSGIEVVLKSGDTMEINVYKEVYRLSDIGSLKIPLQQNSNAVLDGIGEMNGS